MWVQLAIMVVSAIVSVALAPKPPKPKPASFTDFDFPAADEGTPQAVAFGDVWSTGWTVLGVGNYRTSRIRTKGGKK